MPARMSVGEDHIFMRTLMPNHFPLEGSGSGICTLNVAQEIEALFKQKTSEKSCDIKPVQTIDDTDQEDKPPLIAEYYRFFLGRLPDKHSRVQRCLYSSELFL